MQNQFSFELFYYQIEGKGKVFPVLN